MNIRYGVMCAAALVAMASSAFGADTPKVVDEAKAAVTPGEITLTGSQMKTIYHGKKARDYRVCVKQETEAASMKLTADGSAQTVEPGACKEVAGMKIEATPSKPLSGGAHIVATFHHIKPTKSASAK